MRGKSCLTGKLFRWRVRRDLNSRPSESKITTLALGLVEDSVVRSINPDFEVAGSFWPCAFDGWATFFVPDSLMQDRPNQLTLSMCNGPDGLIVPQAQYRAAIDNLATQIPRK
jgi:hypothetical protein